MNRPSRIRLFRGESVFESNHTLTEPTSLKTGATTATGTVRLKSVYDHRSGDLLYVYTTTNVSQTAKEIVDNGTSQTAEFEGVQDISITGLTAETAYYIHTVYVGAGGHYSNVQVSAEFTTDAGGGGGFQVAWARRATQTIINGNLMQ